MPPRTDGSAPMPRLSIIIPTFNGREVLEECLTSVQRYRPAGTETIVVDDGSTDGTAEWLRSAHPRVRLIQLRHNRGFCGAINAGIRQARAPVIETLNNDTVVTPRWAENALRLFEDPSVGSVAPLVWLYREDGLIDSAGDAYHVCGWAMNRGHLRCFGPQFAQVTEVFGASASAAFFRRDALLRVGLFPEHFRAYFDDVDLAFRLRWAGYRCLFTPDSEVYHRLHYSYKHTNARVLRQLFLNEERVFWTNLPARLLLRGLAPHLIQVFCTALGRWVGNQQPAAYLAGKFAVLREFREILRQRRSRQALASDAVFPVRFPVRTDWKTLTNHIAQRFCRVFPFRRARGRPPVYLPFRKPQPQELARTQRRAA